MTSWISMIVPLFYMQAPGTLWAALGPSQDVRQWSSHFRPSEGLKDWQFYTSTGRLLAPEQQKDDHFISTQEHPGLVTIRHSGADEQIKGTIGKPIRVTDTDYYWEFETEVLLHNFWNTVGQG